MLCVRERACAETTLLTVSAKKNIRMYYQWVLKIDDEGGWTMQQLPRVELPIQH
jgi:uncharacterized protein YceK